MVIGIIGFRWKIIVSSVTTNEDARPNSIDLWHSYSTEAAALKTWIAANADDVIVVSGDIHSGGALDDGANGLLGVPEMNVPHTNMNGGCGNRTCGTWSDGKTNGARGYGVIEVTNTSATLSVYGANGSLRDSMGL